MDLLLKKLIDWGLSVADRAADQAVEDGLPPDQALHQALSAAEPLMGTGSLSSAFIRTFIRSREQRRIEIKWAIREGGTSEMNKEIESLLKQILEIDDLSDVRLQKLENCKYLIILDMGCGSTSAAILNLERLKKGELLRDCITPVLWKYRTISVDDGNTRDVDKEPSIPTLIGYSNCNPVVGPVALKTGNACENFKAIPTDENLRNPVLRITGPGMSGTRTLAEVWPDYFRCIADKICSWCAKKSGPANRLNMEEDTLVMVAHPADGEWSGSAVLKNYRALIAEGIGLPDENILTISEAKAAMQYVRRKYGRRLDFERGVVIIDIGASTIDIEYLAKGLDEPFENSLTMAGRDVDKLLLHYALENLYPAEMKKYIQPNRLPGDDDDKDKFFIDHFSRKAAVIKYNARMTKEAVSDLARRKMEMIEPYPYTIGKEDVCITVDTLKGLLGEEKNDPLTGAVFGKRSFPAAYPAYIAEYIRKAKGLQPDTFSLQQVEDTWYGHLENMVLYVMDTLVKEGRMVGQVIVSGGSCRLPGIKKHIWDAIQNSEMGSVFSDPRNIMCMDGEHDYENAVPFGGGYYVGGVLAKLDTLQKFPEKLYTALYKELDSASTEAIADEVNTLVRVITLDSLEWWKDLPNGSADCSTNRLNGHIQSEGKRVFNQTNQLDNAIKAAIGKLTFAASLPKTMGEINALLDTLAGTKFSGQVNTDKIKLGLPANNVANAVRRVNPDTLTLGIWASINGALKDALNGFMNFLRKIFGYEEVEKNDLLRGASYRKGVYDAYKREVKNAVGPQLKGDISNRLRQEFQKTNIFGIPDQIIGVLKQDIIHALYLN